MSNELTHTTVKNDAKEVTHYDIKAANGAYLGKATKTDKGKFNFEPAKGAGKALTDVKTMRDLKVEVAKNVPKGFIEANKPAEKTKAEKPAKTEKPAKPAAEIEQEERDAIEAAAAADDEVETADAPASTDEDIDLD